MVGWEPTLGDGPFISVPRLKEQGDGNKRTVPYFGVFVMHKKVLIINTGGTLSSVAKEHGLTPGLTTSSMLRELHVVAGEAELFTQEFS